MFLDDFSFLSFSVVYAILFFMAKFILELFSCFSPVGSNYSLPVNGSKRGFRYALFLYNYQVNPETQSGEGYRFCGSADPLIDVFPSLLLPLDSPVLRPPSAGLRGIHDSHQKWSVLTD